MRAVSVYSCVQYHSSSSFNFFLFFSAFNNRFDEVENEKEKFNIDFLLLEKK